MKSVPIAAALTVGTNAASAQNARIGDIEIADTIADTGGNSPKLELAVDTVPPAGAEPILLVLRLSFADPQFVRF